MTTPRRQNLRETARRIYIVLVAIAGFLLLCHSVPRLHEALLTGIPWDLMVDYRLGRAWQAGYNPYTPDGARSALLDYTPSALGHPPSTPFWVLPLLLLGVDLKTAIACLAWIAVALLLIELIGGAEALGAPAPHATAWLAFGYVLSGPFMVYQVNVGQFSVPIGFLYFAAWLNTRHGDDVLAGVALGAACTMKPFPGLVVLLFLVLGRWRVVAAALVVFLVISTVMTSRYGLSSWPLFFSNERLVAEDWMDSIQNQSLHGVILRLFHPACGPHGIPLWPATLIAASLSVGLVAPAALWARRASRAGLPLDLPFALFVVLSVLTSPFAWEHYNVIYLLPMAIAAAALVSGWREGASRIAAVAAFLALGVQLATWQLDYVRRLHLQFAVRGGNRQLHLEMHAYEVLNWLPGVLLLIILGWLLRRALDRARADRRPAAARYVPTARAVAPGAARRGADTPFESAIF